MNNETYLEPPEEIETEFCNECGMEMTYHCSPDIKRLKERWFECDNIFCPSLFEGTAKEMAEKLVEVLDTLSRVEKRVKFLSKKIEKLEFHRDEKE